MTSFVGLRVLYDALLLCVHLNGSVQTQLDTPPVALVAVSPTWDGEGPMAYGTEITSCFAFNWRCAHAVRRWRQRQGGNATRRESAPLGQNWVSTDPNSRGYVSFSMIIIRCTVHAHRRGTHAHQNIVLVLLHLLERFNFGGALFQETLYSSCLRRVHRRVSTRVGHSQPVHFLVEDGLVLLVSFLWAVVFRRESCVAWRGFLKLPSIGGSAAQRDDGFWRVIACKSARRTVEVT